MNSGEVLRQARSKLRLTQGGLGKKLGLSQQAVGGWEASGSVPEEHWDDLKEILGVDFSVVSSSNVTQTHVGRDYIQRDRPESPAGSYIQKSDGEQLPVTTAEVYCFELFKQYGDEKTLQRWISEMLTKSLEG